MRDDREQFQPLGPPLREEPPPRMPEWVPVDPARPYLQRNTRDGTMRNVPPLPDG